MRHTIPVVIAICIAALALATAQEESIRLPGQVRFLQSAGDEAIRFISPTHTVQLRSQPPKGVKLPAWANASCRYGVLKLGKPPQEWHLVMDPASTRAVIDANRNSDLTDDEVLRGSADPTWYFGTCYGPFRLAVPLNGVPVSRYFSLIHDEIGSSSVYLRCEDYRLFEGEVNGEAVKLALLDANADGAFDTPAKSRWEGDKCVFLPDREQRPLPRYHKLGDRTYRLTFAPDGSACEFEPSEISTGTVLADYPQVHLTAVGKEVGYWEASTTDGRLQLPTDEYSVLAYRFGTRDSKGNQWQVEITPMDPLPLKVSAGENRFSLPKQLTATLGFGTRQGDTLNISLALYAGSRTQQVSSLAKNDNLPSPPTLRIVDRNGKTVKVETFHYG
ncbi:hypothetical protein HRbin16_00803 [bacterium HR16]|nr:hypothetical protein HRbin16_00803 [bacterium HR16]